MGRRFDYQYRLVWKYKGQKTQRTLVSDRPGPVLRMMRRVGTVKPWTGCSSTQLRRVWAWVARRKNVPFEQVAALSLTEACTELQATFPRLEYIRAEVRQVGEWTSVLDPLHKLQTKHTPRMDKKRDALIAAVADMTREQLDKWRWVPDPESDRIRRRIG